MNVAAPAQAANQNQSSASETRQSLAQASSELVIGLVGFAGSGCTSVGKALHVALEQAGYEPQIIKMSSIIADTLAETSPPAINNEDPMEKGRSTLERAIALQNAGDELRDGKNYKIASLAIDKIIEKRGTREVGREKIAYIIDSFKHTSEVELFRDVYGSSFRLIAVHCDKKTRKERLFGDVSSQAKFAGADEERVDYFILRDEMDNSNKNGQQVRKVFHQADFFLDDNKNNVGSIQSNSDLKRFLNLILGNEFHRPFPSETAIYMAYSAALRSSCLSRQVGAAILSTDGELISIGSNDVPKYGGGTNLEDLNKNARCAYWEFDLQDGGKFLGCHNTRLKADLKEEIAESIKSQILNILNQNSSPRLGEDDVIQKVEQIDFKALSVPKVNDLIEYSRSIHAEMDALFSAARQGKNIVGSTLYCTTFPCHNCARHLVTAGIREVYYVEPYVKSLAIELHSDSIQLDEVVDPEKQTRMAVRPFTGVGPRMYEDHFIKRGELKNEDTGSFDYKTMGSPISGARLDALENIEKAAAGLVKE
ncbi:anti-phage dCTP deaminase [Roseibium sp.]|uniref:anti-phage dCTP deaminase n=1 Tax=Roseibium sp. TaxID=1936156 RepID=UPI003B52D33D